MKQPIELLVLAGGFGTRLRSTISDLPKPLAPVVDKPYLHYFIRNWVEQGVTKMTFLLHHYADMIEEFLELEKRERCFTDCEFRSLTESQPLDTGGAIAHAVQQFQMIGPFLVTNADTWLECGVEQITKTIVPTIATVKVGNTERYGGIQTVQNRVTTFEEKKNSSGEGWINAGLYHLNAEMFSNWDGQPFSLERELFPKLVKDQKLNAVALESNFIDIGIPEDYFRFCRWIESERKEVL